MIHAYGMACLRLSADTACKNKNSYKLEITLHPVKYVHIAIWQYIALCCKAIHNMMLTHIVASLVCMYDCN